MAIKYYIPEDLKEDQIYEEPPDYNDPYEYEVSHAYYHLFGRGHFTGDLFRTFKLNPMSQIYERTKFASFQSICSRLQTKYNKR